MSRSLSYRRRLSVEPLEIRLALYNGFNPTATLVTNFGDIEFELLEDDAPGSVENFLNYVNDGDYVNSIFHRLVPGFVVQGGGFTTTKEIFCPEVDCSLDAIDATAFAEVPTDDPLTNEFGVENVRGTVAMAKLGGDPDSATNQFFVNLADNRSNLDNQNGGFTVFARVNDMTTVDTIAALNQANVSSIFTAEQASLRALTQTPYEITDDGYRWVRVESVTGTSLVHGVVYDDLNANGIKESGDPGRTGITIYDDANQNGQLDAGENQTTSDANGDYHLTFDGDYDYNIRAVAAANNQVTTSQVVSGSIELGQSKTDADFGIGTFGASEGGTVSGVIFFDVDGDGTQDDDEFGRGGITVFEDANDNGVADAGELQATTDSNGAFSIAVSTYDTYTFQYLTSGWTATSPASVEVTISEQDRTQTVSYASQVTIATWHNGALAEDVDGINGVTPLDALQVINELNSRIVSDSTTGALQAATVPTNRLFFPDTNDDGLISPADALVVINRLNASTSVAALSASAFADADDDESDDSSLDSQLIDNVFAGDSL